MKFTISPVLSGFQPPNFTQVFLQPSSTCSRLKPHPPINKLAIVTVLGWQTLAQTGINASPPEMGAVQGERTVFSTHRRTAVAHSEPTKVFPKPRDSHAVCTLRVHPSTSPYPAPSAEAEPISKGHCRKWHHKMKVSCWIYLATSGKGLRGSHLHITCRSSFATGMTIFDLQKIALDRLIIPFWSSWLLDL